MAETVKEVLERIQSKGNDKSPTKGTLNRFSKKNFNDLMKALMNDSEFKAQVAVVKNKELQGTNDVNVSKEFRKFLKKILEKAGIDKKESEMIMDTKFTIDNVDGVYEFLTTAIYEYAAAGNVFDFPARSDFKGNLTIKEKPETSRVTDTRNPQTGESLGTWEYFEKSHKVLVASSPCPEYLKTRKKLKD